MSHPPLLFTRSSSPPQLTNLWQGLDPYVSRDEKSWNLSQLAGRLIELSGNQASATLTAAFILVLDAQHQDEAVAWVTMKQSTFYPPDAAEAGIDLDNLVVVRLGDVASLARATVQLTRSGGFGLVILDIGPEALHAKANGYRRSRKKLTTPLLTKLVGLAQKYDTAVVALTEKTVQSASLSSLISLRAEARRKADVPNEIEISVLKDKRRGPGRFYHEVCRAPAGLR